MKKRNFNYYSWFNKLMLHACGVLPLKSRSFLANSFFMITPIVSSSFLLGPAIYALTFHWNRLQLTERMDIASEEIEIIVGAIKVCILIPKREKLFKLTESCEKLWQSIESDEDSTVVEVYAARGLYMTYFFAFNCFIGCSSFLITPLFTSFVIDTNGTVLVSNKLPYAAGIFHEDVRQFNLWHFLQVPTAYDSVMAIVAIDTAIAFYILHACAHMRLCQKLFRNVADNFSLVKRRAMTDKEWHASRYNFAADVVRCVAYHRLVLKYSEDVEDIFSGVILIQALQGITAICGYSFSIIVGEGTQGPRYIIHLMGATVQLLLLCWPPDSLQDESIKVADAAYDLPWYDWTAKEGRLVSMVIAKSQRPVKITANKFSIISLGTFSWILKTAFSMVTLLLNVME